MNNQDIAATSAWVHFKEEILHAKRMIITLDQNDLEYFEEGNKSSIFVLEADTDNTSEGRFKILCDNLLEQYRKQNTKRLAITKMIMFIQYPTSNPVTMEEMSTSVENLINTIVPIRNDCQIKWGMGTREDNISRIIMAVLL